ncbi:MAG: hypothetical protein JW995_12190 [Melioribacteraceae bacterium]|nr:hypothetical protein [Melioribacteraceae bacterium]
MFGKDSKNPADGNRIIPILLTGFVIIILFSAQSKAQYLTKEKITFYASTVAFCLLEGYTEAYMTLEKHETDPVKRLKYNQTWHRLKTYREISTIGTGIAVSLDTEFKPLEMLSNLFVTASIYWILHDELINRINGWDNIPFGYSSRSMGGSFNNGSFMDQFANPYLKIFSLLLSVTINILLTS